MSTTSSFFAGNSPRPQAARIVRIVAQEGFAFRGTLLGKRREGKTDLLRQIHALLFEKAEGPIPFFYTFEAARKEAALARHFFSAFCMQVRAFLMRQEDLLREPPASLERELERAGLPLSLTEMARNFLALPPVHQLDFAASLAAQFVAREDRPVCLLLDDLHEKDPASSFFTALDSPHLSWLAAGRYPFLLRMAGQAAWTLVSVDPFSSEEALAQARKRCETAGVPYFPPVWEQWCEISGSSSWLIDSLVTAAAVRGLALDSIEQLGRLYIQELACGTLGNWFLARFAQAIPDRSDRTMVGEYLAGLAQAGIPSASASALPSRVWDGLIAEEWAEEAVTGPRILLDMVQRDWFSLSTAPAGEPSERAQARLLLTFLLRVERAKEQPETARFSMVIRQRLFDLPHAGFPEHFTWENQKIRLPRIFSVSGEAAGSAELFWCYGFYGDHRESTEAAVLLLIVICDEAPTDGQVEKWARQLENEARLVAPPRTTASVLPDGSRPHRELWIAVPPGTSLASTGPERRFSWQAFFRLMVQAGAPDESPPSDLRE
jgi:hypothetical protein